MASERAERLADVWDGAVGDPITTAEAREVLSLWRDTTQLCNALNQLVNQYDDLAAELREVEERERALTEERDRAVAVANEAYDYDSQVRAALRDLLGNPRWVSIGSINSHAELERVSAEKYARLAALARGDAPATEETAR